jgi:hypothetical protein
MGRFDTPINFRNIIAVNNEGFIKEIEILEEIVFSLSNIVTQHYG